MSALDPNPMSPSERLDEVARILALGILRLQARQDRGKPNDPNHLRKFELDFSRPKSVSGFEPDDDREGRSPRPFSSRSPSCRPFPRTG